MIEQDGPELPSERKFGILFVVVFALLGGYALYAGWGQAVVVSSFALAVVLAIVAFTAPKLLAPFNKAWFMLGMAIGKVVSPIVLGIIFFGLLTPVAVITRLFGRDELRLKQQGGDTYWIDRNPPGPASDSYNNQF